MRELIIVLLFISLSSPLFSGGQDEQMMDKDQAILTLWTTENQPERIEVQESIAADFFEKTGIEVEVVPVEENDLAARATAAFGAGDLPDVIYAPLKDAVNWATSGIANIDAATDAIQSLGADTFASGSLELIEQPGGRYGAVPVDGWTQLLVYRKDLFDANNLRPPRTYADIERAIEVLHDPPNLYGFVAATDPSQAYMMQVFEHLSLANGASVVDDNGNISVDTPEMRAALDFYTILAEASPPGNLYWQQSRELYLAGNAAMIVWSPFIMDELAGLRDSAPVTYDEDPESRELASRTDFLTRISGPDNPNGSGYSDIRYLVVTADADEVAAQSFVEFSLNEGYTQTLAIAPEGKFPVRRGDQNNPRRFVDEWANLEVGVDRRAKLSDLYAPEVINNVVEGLDRGSRWGFDKGYGDLIAKIYDTMVFSQAIRRLIDGEASVAEIANEAQSEIEALQSQ